jgi:hypothetical protein
MSKIKRIISGVFSVAWFASALWTIFDPERIVSQRTIQINVAFALALILGHFAFDYHPNDKLQNPDLSNYTFPEREGIRKFLRDIKGEK